MPNQLMPSSRPIQTILTPHIEFVVNRHSSCCWKENARRSFDLTKESTEEQSVCFAEVEARQPAVAAKFAELKVELARLQKKYQDEGQYAAPAVK